MKIKNRNIIKAVFLSQEKGLFEGLNKIYNKIPTGVCNHCNKCCSEDIDLSFLEFINIYKYLKDNDIYDEMSQSAIKYYMKEFIYRGSCPLRNA